MAPPAIGLGMHQLGFHNVGASYKTHPRVGPPTTANA